MTTSPAPDATGPLTRELVLDEPFIEADLQALRRAVAAHADRSRLPRGRVADLVLIASELAANAIRHGGGKGRLRLWQTADALVCQVTDHGPGLPAAHTLPAQRPEPTVTGGRGLWLVLTYADAVAIRSDAGNGTTITATLALTD
jgi:anti-sigma regulatory factor (Ser/Thr protein kinase)